MTKSEPLGGQGLLWLSSHIKVRPIRVEAEAQFLQSIPNSFLVIRAMSGVFRRGQPVTDLSCGGLRPDRRCSLCTCQYCNYSIENSCANHPLRGHLQTYVHRNGHQDIVSIETRHSSVFEPWWG